MSEKKALVAYFSASGVTRHAAAALAQTAAADLFEIRPVVPYTNADLNWTDKKSRSTVEMKDMSFRPPMAEKCPNIRDYDVIFVGFPIWWYIAPTIINTFLESHDLSGKTIVPFATSGGSGMGRTVEHLKGSCPPSAVITEGRLLNGRLTAQEWTAWKKRLGM